MNFRLWPTPDQSPPEIGGLRTAAFRSEAEVVSTALLIDPFDPKRNSFALSKAVAGARFARCRCLRISSRLCRQQRNESDPKDAVPDVLRQQPPPALGPDD